MQIDWWTLALQTINVLVLVFILARFLFRPVVKIMAERQAAATHDLDAARAARAAAEAARVKSEAEIAAIAAERSGKVQAAVAEGEAEKAKIVAAAKAEAETLRTNAQAEIAHLHASAQKEEDDRASRLAVDIAARVLERLPAEDLVTAFIPGLAEGVAGLPEASRAAVDADGTALRIKAARALSDDEAAACRAALGKALGREVEIAVEVDPSLIAGLELDAPHAVVRNHLKADLDRILVELTRHAR